jgi:hypothetical protein
VPLGYERGSKLVEGPGEIVAVIVEGNVGVLAGVEAAIRLVGQVLVDPVKDALRGFSQKWVLRDLVAIEIVLQQFRIVVRHFLEMRDEPALIHGIAVETTAELVIHAAPGHFFERGFGNGEEMFFFRLLIAFEEKIDGRSVGEFRRVAEAAILDVETFGDRADLLFDDAEIEVGAGPGKDFGLRDRVGKRIGGALQLSAFVAVGIGDGQQDAAKTGAAHLIVWRKIGAAKKRFAIGE